MKQITH